MNIDLVSSNNKNSPALHPAFKSRNANLRFADHVMRVAKNEIPMFSTTRILSSLEDKSRLTHKQSLCLKNIISKNRELRDMRPDSSKNPLGYIKMLLFSVSISKIGNCGEMGTIGKLALAANGIRDVKKVSLFVYDSFGPGRMLDHSFNIVNLSPNADLKKPSTYGKNAYTVDLWAGVVDTVENTFKRFEAEYSGDIRLKGIEIKKPKTRKEKLERKTLGVNIDYDFEVDDAAIAIVNRVFPKLNISKK